MRRLFRMLACLGLVTAFLGCSAPEKRQTAGEYIDDSVITSKVKAAIVNEEALKGMQVNVKTHDGTVQLSGFVDNQQQARQAASVAGKVEGVKNVQNDLIVK
ncbi:BON domain-containing protein [Geomonas sp. RF6]|uniref:BON domain-containing protein n=1 Tax=Geomonas sp. RF6 TaxID=2897342 RepID=UPI001E4F34C2|nr:BON domain-containing protein [Geomonas sp. RF6]UFS71130.1 BON domain-containing protein [Geomonas sp. RF6]